MYQSVQVDNTFFVAASPPMVLQSGGGTADPLPAPHTHFSSTTENAQCFLKPSLRVKSDVTCYIGYKFLIALS